MKRIVFDLDNTLLFISNDWEDYYQRFLDQHHFSITPKDLYSAIGRIEIHHSDVLVTKDFFMNCLKKELSISMNEEILQDFFNMYAEIPLLNLKNVSLVLEYLSFKYEIIAYSNWFTENQLLRLKKNHLDSFFAKVYGCDILPIKPSVRGIKKIIGNHKKEDVLFIGDNIKIDIEVPHRLGINTIFFNRHHLIQDQYKEIFHIEDLMNLL